MSFDGYHFAGLKKTAQKMAAGEPVLAYTEDIVRIYPNGRREKAEDRPVFVSTVKRDLSGEKYEDEAWLGPNGIPFYKYTMPDGRVLFEREQKEGFMGGGGAIMVLLTALQDENGNWLPDSLWTKDEIAKAMCNEEHGRDLEEDGEFWAEVKSSGAEVRIMVTGTNAKLENNDYDLSAFRLIKPFSGDEIGPYKYYTEAQA